MRLTAPLQSIDFILLAGPKMMRNMPAVDEQKAGEARRPVQVAGELIACGLKAGPGLHPSSFPFPDGLAGNPTPTGLLPPDQGEERRGRLGTGDGDGGVQVMAACRRQIDGDESCGDSVRQIVEVVGMTLNADLRVRFSVAVHDGCPAGHNRLRQGG